MPPAIFVAASSATVADADTLRFEIPATAKARDAILLVAAVNTAIGPDDVDALEAEGWQIITLVGGAATRKLILLLRELGEGEGANIDLDFDGAFVGTVAGACLVYRNVNPQSPLDDAIAVDVTASTNFVCPSQALTTYSDLYIGIAFVTTAAVAVAPPAGTTERLEQQTGGMTIEVFDYLMEATGATGTKTAVAGSAQSGLAASVKLAANAVVGAGLSLSFDPIGAIGLPSRGV